MEQHEIDAELSMPGAQELPTSTSAAHLAYVGEDGAPRVIPVGFFWTGDQVVISTATTSPKVTALSARPDVALAIDAGNTPDGARALSIRGRASVEIVEGVVEEYLAAARRRWITRRQPSSNGTSARCTTRWHESRSRRAGCATSTSALAGCRDSCRSWPSGTSPESGLDLVPIRPRMTSAVDVDPQRRRSPVPLQAKSRSCPSCSQGFGQSGGPTFRRWRYMRPATCRAAGHPATPVRVSLPARILNRAVMEGTGGRRTTDLL
jgi:hypothetical protein